MKNLTAKKMLLVSAIFLILDIVYIYYKAEHFGYWFTPTVAKFMLKDLFLIAAWIIWFIDRRKRK